MAALHGVGIQDQSTAQELQEHLFILFYQTPDWMRNQPI
jgi:hypothetical protein